jgi:2-polyprenyl-3-methyl-5-hydroxy-6-metoxy-1,4-benzoquinol methylase
VSGSQTSSELAELLVGFVRKRLKIRGANALDIGCGSGGLLLALSPYIKTGTGIDKLEEAIAIANGNHTSVRDNVVFLCADLAEYSSSARSPQFDCALCLFSLHHVGIDEFAKGIRRLVRPGGCVLVIDFLNPTVPKAGQATNGGIALALRYSAATITSIWEMGLIRALHFVARVRNFRRSCEGKIHVHEDKALGRLWFQNEAAAELSKRFPSGQFEAWFDSVYIYRCSVPSVREM